jgi:hypothetical protein
MNKEFVSYEQAVALKELGFNEICMGYFDVRLEHQIGNFDFTEIKGYHESVAALSPLKQQVFRWFREKKLHNTFPSIIQTRNWVTLYRILEWHPGNDSTSISTSDYYDTYEEAESACIDKLIELAKQQKNG